MEHKKLRCVLYSIMYLCCFMSVTKPSNMQVHEHYICYKGYLLRPREALD